MERWETMYFEGRRAGFLLRSVQDGVLTTRTAFGGARPGEHRAGPAERFLSESTITLSARATVQGWRACTFQDSSATQRVSVDRERAGLDRDALPSYGEWMLLQQLAAQGGRPGRSTSGSRSPSSSPGPWHPRPPGWSAVVPSRSSGPTGRRWWRTGWRFSATDWCSPPTGWPESRW